MATVVPRATFCRSLEAKSPGGHRSPAIEKEPSSAAVMETSGCVWFRIAVFAVREHPANANATAMHPIIIIGFFIELQLTVELLTVVLSVMPPDDQSSGNRDQKT